MDKSLVDALKLPLLPIAEGTAIDAAGKSHKHMTESHSIVMGDIQAKHTQFIVSHEDGNHVGSPFQAIFGNQFLEANDLEIDLAHGKVNIFSPDHCPGQVVYWTHESVPIPITIVESGHIALSISLDGVRAFAMLDTGAGPSLISKRVAESEFNIVFADKPDGYVTASTGSRLPFYRHIFGKFDIGGLEFHNTEFEISPDTLNHESQDFDPHSSMRADREEKKNMPVILGIHHLSKLRMYFSFKERMLYVTPANAS